MRDNIEFTDPELSSESTLSRILIGRICRLGLPKGLCHYNTTKSEILEPAVSPGRFILPAAMYGSRPSPACPCVLPLIYPRLEKSVIISPNEHKRDRFLFLVPQLSRFLLNKALKNGDLLLLAREI